MARIEPRPPRSTAATRVRVFLVEDDAEMRKLLELSLELEGFDVLPLANGGELLRELGIPPAPAVAGDATVIVSDIRLPGPTGLEILDAIGAQEWCPPVILITAFGGPAIYEQAKRMGAAAVLDKPFDIAVLARLIHEAAGVRQRSTNPDVGGAARIE